MLFNSQQRGLIIKRCWLIYELISDKLQPPYEFHIEFPSLVEFALTSGYFQVLVVVNRSEHFLHIHEEYDFREYMLLIKAYNYILLDKYNVSEFVFPE